MIKFDENHVQPEWAISIEEIKSKVGFENISDEDAELIIKTFSLLSQALYESEIRNING